jgi:hypothetical protein
MPRDPRGWDPSAPDHITDRGFEGSPLFVTDEDRAFFLDRAAALFKALGVTCFAWALMTKRCAARQDSRSPHDERSRSREAGRRTPS